MLGRGRASVRSERRPTPGREAAEPAPVASTRGRTPAKDQSKKAAEGDGAHPHRGLPRTTEALREARRRPDRDRLPQGPGLVPFPLSGAPGQGSGCEKYFSWKGLTMLTAGFMFLC